MPSSVFNLYKTTEDGPLGGNYCWSFHWCSSSSFSLATCFFLLTAQPPAATASTVSAWCSAQKRSACQHSPIAAADMPDLSSDASAHHVLRHFAVSFGEAVDSVKKDSGGGKGPYEESVAVVGRGSKG